jgi:TPR repeat protein
MAYEDGVGVEKNIRTALTWFLAGASKGDAFAQKKYEALRNMGVNAFRGKGKAAV